MLDGAGSATASGLILGDGFGTVGSNGQPSFVSPFRAAWAGNGRAELLSFDPFGTLEGVIEVAASGSPREAALAVNEINEALVVWIADGPLASAAVFGRLSLGERGLSPAFQISVAGAAAPIQLRVASDGDSFLVVWEANGEILGRLVDGGGRIQGDVVRVAERSSDHEPSVAGGPEGRFTVVWERSDRTSGPGGDVDIYLRRYATVSSDAPSRTLTLNRSGAGRGRITGPSGLDCGTACSAELPVGSPITSACRPKGRLRTAGSRRARSRASPLPLPSPLPTSIATTSHASATAPAPSRSSSTTWTPPS